MKILPQNESWLRSTWRPTMAWTYMIICLFDFIIGPVVWTVFQINADTGSVATQWIPLTLGSGGLFHMAMGAILGVTAWQRGQEKIAGVAGDPKEDNKPIKRPKHQEEFLEDGEG